MSKKFEQLLDLIVNEEMDKANELFHEIVVEKSRSIYENLIAQEAEEETEMDESEDEDNIDESEDEDNIDESEEDTDESVELEDSYMMDGDDEDEEPSGIEQTDDLEGDVSADDDMGDMGGDMSGEEQVEFDIRDAIEKLEAALASLEGGDDMGGEMGGDEFDDEMGDMGGDEEEPEMMGMYEGKKRMTREYVEKVGNDWDKNGSMKTQKQYVGSGSGDKEGAPDEGKSPIASGSNKPGPAGVNAKNLVQGATEGQSNTGTSPGKVSKGLAPHSGEKFASGVHNVDGKKSGVKTLSGVKGGHGAEKKGSGAGPVGSGSGDKAGQTSTPAVKQFLKPYGN